MNVDLRHAARSLAITLTALADGYMILVDNNVIEEVWFKVLIITFHGLSFGLMDFSGAIAGAVRAVTQTSSWAEQEALKAKVTATQLKRAYPALVDNDK